MRERGAASLFFFSLSKKAPVRSKVRRCIFFCFRPPRKKKFQWTSSLLKKEGRTKKNKDGKEKRQNTDNKTKDKQDQKGVKKRQRRKNQIEIKSK